MSVLTPAIVGSLLLAVLSTVADYVWFRNIPQHQVSSGMIHGAVLFAALGAYLGWRRGKVAIGAIGGLVSGMVAALSFYALAPIGGYPMMLVSWVVLWILLAALVTHLDGKLDPARAIGRGLVTAIAAGLGFAVVDGVWAPTRTKSRQPIPASATTNSSLFIRPYLRPV